jgi:hypothetical protein
MFEDEMLDEQDPSQQNQWQTIKDFQPPVRMTPNPATVTQFDQSQGIALPKTGGWSTINDFAPAAPTQAPTAPQRTQVTSTVRYPQMPTSVGEAVQDTIS